MQRCLSILRRNTAVLTAGGVLLVGIYEFCKQCVMQTGKIESDLARVTMSKIGSDDPFYERTKLLDRLINYRRFFRKINSLRESAIAARLDIAIVDMQTDVSTGALRRQPFCVMLYGPPGVGKSSFAIQIAQAIMKYEHGTFNSAQMVTLNETDDYQSEFRSSHKVVLFDDIAAARTTHSDTKNPWRKVIDFVNNVQKTALNPNCEMKGKVYIKPDLVILTSNINFDKGWGEVDKTMNCTEAIQRRCKRTVRLHDYEKVSFTEFSKHLQSRTSALGAVPVNVSSEPANKISRAVAVQSLLDEYILHMKSQTEFVRTFNDYFDDLRIEEDFVYPSNLKGECIVSEFLDEKSGHCESQGMEQLKVDLPEDELSPVDLPYDEKPVVQLISYPLTPSLELEVNQINRLIDNSILMTLKSSSFLNYSLGSHSPLGEIDLLVIDQQTILVLEAKRSIGKTPAQKARQQVLKYSRAMSILMPKARIYGVSLTYSRIQLDYDNLVGVGTSDLPGALDVFVSSLSQNSVMNV